MNIKESFPHLTPAFGTSSKDFFIWVSTKKNIIHDKQIVLKLLNLLQSLPDGNKKALNSRRRTFCGKKIYYYLPDLEVNTQKPPCNKTIKTLNKYPYIIWIVSFMKAAVSISFTFRVPASAKLFWAFIYSATMSVSWRVFYTNCSFWKQEKYLQSTFLVFKWQKTSTSTATIL